MTIEAMKQALEALELAQNNLRPHGDNCFLHAEGGYNRCFCGKDSLVDYLQEQVEDLSKAIAEAEKQEPVAWLYESPMPDNSMFVGSSVERLKIGIGVTPDTIETPLYTHPPKHEWVDLTIGETAIIVKMLERGNFIVAIAAVQAKLKEKNT